MDLKYICKNDSYIIDRKFKNDTDSINNTFKTKGTMILKESLPEDIKIKNNLIEYAFDNMKEDVIKSLKKKYFLKEEEVVTFYFEGRLEKENTNKTYAVINNEKIPMYETNLNLDFEVECKVTPKNFLKLQYDNFKCILQNT